MERKLKGNSALSKQMPGKQPCMKIKRERAAEEADAEERKKDMLSLRKLELLWITTLKHILYHDAWVRCQGIRESVWRRDRWDERPDRWEIQQQRGDWQEGSCAIHPFINTQSRHIRPATAGVFNAFTEDASYLKVLNNFVILNEANATMWTSQHTYWLKKKKNTVYKSPGALLAD